MSAIGSRTFNLIPDKYLTLANEEYVRTLSIGNDWNRIRLGMLAALTTDGTNNLSGTHLVWGLCSGKTNPFGAASTTNFLGLKFGYDTNGDALVYAANSGNPYFWSGRSQATRVGATTTFPNGNSLEYHRIATNTGSVQRKSVHYLEITKGSPNFTVAAWSLSPTGVAKDFTPAHLLDGIEQPSSITINGESIGTGLGGAVAFNETAGALDSVDVFWNRSAFPLEVYALAAFRHS